MRKLLMCFLLSTLPVLAQGDPRLVISRPLVGESLVGKVDVAVIPENIDDSQVLSLQIVLDGRTLAELGEPPWRVTIDAGPDLATKRLDVVVRLVDGGILRAGRTYEPAPAMQEVDVRLVSLSVSVEDRRDRPVQGLEKEDFEVFDAGQRVEIERFSAFPESLAIAVVIDSSGSMTGERLEAAREAARIFVESLGEEDRLAVVRFSDDVATLSPLSRDREDSLTALRGLRSEGGTALHDAIVHTSELLSETPPGTRRAIILLSDGRDESSSGLEPGSFHTLREAIKQAHMADAEIFTLGIGAQLDLETDFTDKLTTAEVLERIALSTGGRFERVRKVRRLSRHFEAVLEELRAQYSIAYTPAPPRPGESWRSVEVRVRREGASARTREGYFIR